MECFSKKHREKKAGKKIKGRGLANAHIALDFRPIPSWGGDSDVVGPCVSWSSEKATELLEGVQIGASQVEENVGDLVARCVKEGHRREVKSGRQ